MKKIVTFLLLSLILPFYVSAASCDVNKIIIESITLEDSNGVIYEKADASIENNTINLDIKMSDVGDNLQYKLDIKNELDEDVEVKDVNINNNYIDYTLSTEDNSNIIEANTRKSFYLNIQYRNEIPVTSMNNGTYNNNDNITINLSTKDTFEDTVEEIIEDIVNPKTGDSNILLILLLVLLGSFLSYRYFNKKSYSSTLILLVGIMIPLCIYASCNYDITINSEIEISKIAEFDDGFTFNSKLSYLSNNLNHIQTITRSDELPDDIKTLVDNQKIEANNISITDEEVETEFERLQTSGISFIGFSIEEENGETKYCKINNGNKKCDDGHNIIVDLKYSKNIYAIILREEDSEEKNYLIYDNELKQLTETEFKKYLRKYLLKKKKDQTTQNIFSSDESYYPIYGWFDTDTFYYYSEEENLYLNKNSSAMFKNLEYLGSASDIGNLNTSNVKDMSGMFYNTSSYSRLANLDMNLSSWNTSNVEDMSTLFSKFAYKQFHIGDLSNWNTSSVKDMSYMFYNSANGTSDWNIGNLKNWDVSNVINMSHMFSHCAEYAESWSIGDISHWNISNVKIIDNMFWSAGVNSNTFSIDVSNWDVSHITNLNNLFSCSGRYSTSWSIGDLSNWDVSNITNMESLFSSTGENDPNWSVGDLSNWNTSNVTNMHSLFSSTGKKVENYSLNISNWNTSKVTDMAAMFAYSGHSAKTYAIDVSNWDVSNVEDIRSMFAEVGYNAHTWSIGDLSNWDTSKMSNMSNVFSYIAANARETKNLGTLKVYSTNTSDMFNGASRINLILNLYNNPTDYSYMFRGAVMSDDMGIVVNYTNEVTNINAIINTKSPSSHVTKGELIE